VTVQISTPITIQVRRLSHLVMLSPNTF